MDFLVDQFRADSVASRGKGYGMATLKVDGNDALAVYQSIKEAREYSVKKQEPVLIELMTYRVLKKHHIYKNLSFKSFKDQRSFYIRPFSFV